MTISRFVNPFNIRFRHRYVNNSGEEDCCDVDIATVINRVGCLPLDALSSEENQTRYWRKGQDDYIFQSDGHLAEGEFLCLRVIRLIGGQIPAVISGDIELIEIPEADGVGYVTHVVINKNSGHAIIESTRDGPHVSGVRRYYESVLDGDQECLVNECTIEPLIKPELFDRFLNQMGSIASFEVQVVRSAYEEASKELDWDALTKDAGRKLSDAIEGAMTFHDEMAIIHLGGARQPFARSGGGGRGLKEWLQSLLKIERRYGGLFRRIRVNVEGGSGTPGRLGMVDLLNDYAKTMVEVKLDHRGRIDSQDMFKKMIEYLQREFEPQNKATNDEGV